MAELTLLDPLALDRDVRAAARDLRRARAAFNAGNVDDAPAPFARRRRVSSKVSFDELYALPSDPFFHALAQWIGALTISRVTFDDEEAIATAFAAKDHRVEISEGPVSARGLCQMLLAEPSSSARRPHIARAFEETAGPTRHALAKYAERRREAARLLGSDPSAIDVAPLASVAERVRKELSEMLSFGDSGTLGAVLDASLARDATEGWPAALGSRWLAETFRVARLFDAIRLDLGELPAALGGASFCRALAGFGRAFADADLHAGSPFVLSRAPNDLLAPSRAALFGGLPMAPAFNRTVLGLGRDRAREQARRVARGLATALVLDAIGTLTSIALFAAPSSAGERFEDLTERTFGAAWPRGLAGVLPRARVDRPTSFAGVLLAAGERLRLRDVHDEDWFRNVRAYDDLRHAHSSSPKLPDGAALEALAGSLVRTFREALG